MWFVAYTPGSYCGNIATFVLPTQTHTAPGGTLHAPEREPSTPPTTRL